MAYYPKKYFSGLSKEEKAKRKKEIQERSKLHWDDPKAYEPFSTDKVKKTQPSKYTKAYKAKYEHLEEEALEESKKGLKKKSEESGIPYSILKQVYDRGVAAWRTGHRPGITPEQWGYARVNSFIMKGKTWHTTDADLAKKAKQTEALEGRAPLIIIERICDNKELNDPWRTSKGPKKFSVCVKDGESRKKVNFGDPNMEIKRDSDVRRKSFRARHNCDQPGPKTKARYWSCQTWRRGKTVKDIIRGD